MDEQFAFRLGRGRNWLRLSSQSHPENFQSRRKQYRSTIEPVGKFLP
jgi:hypothetical protein